METSDCPSCESSSSKTHSEQLDSSEVDSSNEDVSFPDSSQPIHLKSLRSSNLTIWGSIYNNPSLAGYNPRTGRFEIEYANNAEEIMTLASGLYDYSVRDRNETNEEEEKLMEELQVTLGEIYNSTLQERAMRKKVIAEHGLMDLKGTKLWYSRLEKIHGIVGAKKLIRFTRLMTANEAEWLHRSLERVNKMRFDINKLIYYRAQHGISCKSSLQIFEREKAKRTPREERQDVRSVILPEYAKRKKQPKEIFHLPKFTELTPSEAELCLSVGVNPEFFLNTKRVLWADCKKSNGMVLKRARKLVKIDVNKTRKIFDFFMEQGILWPPVKSGGGNTGNKKKPAETVTK